MSQHIIFKTVLMTQDCIRGWSPAYFHDVCVPVASVAFRSQLCSADHEDMIAPCTRTVHYRSCSFRVIAPQTWNMLPSQLKDRNISREQFNQALRPGSLCKPTHRKCLWELQWSCTLQIPDLIDDWLLIESPSIKQSIFICMKCILLGL